METSILKSTKKVLGLAADYTAFDEDILMYINSAFSSLTQLGVGPAGGFTIEDEQKVWADLAVPSVQLDMVKTYIYLKVRMLFDPPTTSFLIEAVNTQIKEHEWRLNMFREVAVVVPEPVLDSEGNEIPVEVTW